jgi:hypothetical protein
MIAQNYNSEDAFARWRPTGLQRHLQHIRQSFRPARLFAPVPCELPVRVSGVSLLKRCFAAKFGIITWGVFTRAFWPIYQRGVSPRFYGSVIFSSSPEDEDAPSLFEIAQEVRTARDDDVAIDGIEDFLSIIRDDYSLAMRVPVPEVLAMDPGYHLQSIGIERHKLPQGYLHHRLVPILTHPRIPYATLVDCKYWSPGFTAIWQSGDPLLTPAECRIYQSEFPEVVP